MRAKPPSQTRRIRGETIVPANPSGRLVITDLDGIKNGGVQVTHWLPAQGTDWTCPDCRREFVRDDGGRNVPWRARSV